MKVYEFVFYITVICFFIVCDGHSYVIVSLDRYRLPGEIITPLTANNINVENKDDIQKKNPQTLADTLKYIPGIRLSTGDKNEPGITIRGFSQEKLMILIDGVPVSEASYGYTDLSQIPSENIEKIEIVKGPGSVFYGPNTLGGVVNFVTRKPGEKPCLSLNTMFSINNTQDYVISYSKKFGKTSLWTSASHRISDGFILSNNFVPDSNEDGGVRDNSGYIKNALHLNYGWQPSEVNSLVFSLSYIDNEKDLPAHISSSRPKYWRFDDWKEIRLSVSERIEVSNRFLTEWKVYYDKHDNILDAYSDNTYTSKKWISTYDDYSSGINFHSYFKINRKNSLKNSITLKKDIHREQDDTDSPWELYDIETYSVAIEDESKITEDLTFTGGLSHDIMSQKYSENGIIGNDIGVINPAMGVSCQLSNGNLLFTSVSRRTCFPTIHQLYSNISGNPDLKEQTNISGEAGIKHILSQTDRIELSLFYNNVTNLIDRKSRNDIYMNLQNVIIKGFETDIVLLPLENLGTNISYTYINAADMNPELLSKSQDDVELAYTPVHKAELELRYSFSSGLSVDLIGTYNSEMCYFDNDNIKQKLNGNCLINFGINWDFHFWKFSAIIDNVFDSSYQEEEGYPMPGRTIRLRIAKDF